MSEMKISVVLFTGTNETIFILVFGYILFRLFKHVFVQEEEIIRGRFQSSSIYKKYATQKKPERRT